jgi:hypothetical protein
MAVCQVTAAHALAVSASLVAVACASGVVRLFSAGSLAFRGNLPRPSSRAAQRAGGEPETRAAPGECPAVHSAQGSCRV